MARVRSPNYPNISLPAAIDRVRKVHSLENQNEVDRESFVKILGYSSMSGPASKALSSLNKYGLITKAGTGEVKVSDLAMDIMYGEAGQKEDAIEKAANTPSLFAEINAKWPEHPPSNENLRSYLARRGFSLKVLDQVIGAYRETMSLVSDESAGYDSEPITQGSAKGIIMETDTALPVTPVLSRGEPGDDYRVSLTASGIEGTFSITSKKKLEQLITTLQRNAAGLSDGGENGASSDEQRRREDEELARIQREDDFPDS